MELLQTTSHLDDHDAASRDSGKRCKNGGEAKQIEELRARLNHELRTPLTSVRAFSNILLHHPDMDLGQRRQFLAILVEEAERLTAVVNRLLPD